MQLKLGLPFTVRGNCPSVVFIFEIVSPSSAVVLVNKSKRVKFLFFEVEFEDEKIVLRGKSVFDVAIVKITGLLFSIPLHLWADGSNP